MAKNIDPSLKLISEYLKLKKSEYFVIPEYQRSYSWNITQCDKLWQDVETFISSESDDPYFFGTIIVDCSDSNKFNLIDGQQRTTTFLLLLKALLLNLNIAIQNISDDEETEALKAGLKANRNKIMSILYKAEDEDIPSMLKDHTKVHNILILENNSINELYREEVKKIIEAVDFSEAEIKVSKILRKQKDNKYTNHFRNFKFFYERLREKTESQLNKFAKKFLNECQIIEIRSWQVEQAIMMFNSLNSTGLPLSDADIISAYLYSNAGNDKDKFNEQWEFINKLTNDLNVHKIVNIDGVLQQFMYISRAVNQDYITTKEDGNKSVDVAIPGLRRYYTEVKSDLLKSPLELCEHFDRIVKKWDRIKNYEIVKLLLKYNENAKLFLSSYLYRFEIEEIDQEKITELCECLIRLFTILELSDIGYSSSKFKTFLFSENVKLVDKNISIEIIKRDFDSHINKNWNKENLTDLLLEYEKNILVFLNEYLYAKEKQKAFDFAENVNIEHIMPSSGRNIDIIQQDAKITDREEFKIVVNKLGNKILLEDDINKSIGNEWFKTKKQNSIYSKKGYKDSKYPIASTLINYPKDVWTKEDIEITNEKIAQRVVKFVFNE